MHFFTKVYESHFAAAFAKAIRPGSGCALEAFALR
jgi:hypothetical protein